MDRKRGAARLFTPICLGFALFLFACDPLPIPTPPEPPAATAGGSLPAADLTIANLNILHGFWLGALGCTPDTDNCDAPGRVEVAMRHIEDIGCPDVVTLQEIDTRMSQVMYAAVPDYCGGAYEIRFLPSSSVSLGIDQEMVLTQLPVLDEYLLDLPSFPYSAHHIVLDSDLGRVDLVTAHLPASATNFPCLLAGCPSYCDLDDDNARECSARQILRHLGTVAPDDSVHIVTGDLNAEPGSITYDLFVDHFFADSHLVAGNPECDAAHRENCTGGGRQEPGGLYDATALNVERIDYIMVRGHAACPALFDTAADLDGDGVGTGNWANLPIAPPGAGGLLFASDHSGTQADLHCG